MHKNKMPVEYGPELRKLNVLYFLFAFLIIALIVMPQYFGVHIGYDLTCTRIANILILFYFCYNKPIFTHFIHVITKCESLYPLLLYLFVSIYTMVYRGDLNAFFSVFFEILTFFMMIYGIRYVTGYKKAIRWTLGCAYFLVCYGLVEFVYGRSIYLQFLRTLPTQVTNIYRSGHYRIMGPCGHSLGYGLLLLLLLPLACYDLDKDEVYIFKRPVLLILLLINIFLTGSRSTLGIAVVELIVLIFCESRTNLKKTLTFMAIFLGAFLVVLMAIQKTSIGRYLMGQITSVIDEIAGTNFSINFGIDTTALENSTAYRQALPYIFTLPWLNPLVGRGRAFGGAEINGIFVHSVDNFYIMQYIKYAYPGMISYILFILVSGVSLLRNAIKLKSDLIKIVLVGGICYFVNLWWVDALQTLKFIYLLFAIYYAYRLEKTQQNSNK